MHGLFNENQYQYQYHSVYLYQFLVFFFSSARDIHFRCVRATSSLPSYLCSSPRLLPSSAFCLLPSFNPSDCPTAMLFIDFIASAALHQQPQTCSHFFVHSISRLLSIIYSIAYLQCLNGAAQAVSPQNPHYSTSRKNSGLHSPIELISTELTAAMC